MKPDRVSCCCFECKQFSHFHPGPGYKYWHLVIWKALEHWILQSSHRESAAVFWIYALVFRPLTAHVSFNFFCGPWFKKMWGGQFVEDIVSAWLWMNILDVTTPVSLHSGWRPPLPVALRLPEAQGFPHICAHYFSDKDKNKTHICAHYFENFFLHCRQKD